MVNAEAQRRRVIDNQLDISAPLCLRVHSIYFLHNPDTFQIQIAMRSYFFPFSEWPYAGVV